MKFARVLPLVSAEAATEIVSLATGFLSIPPILGIGSLVDCTILAVGLATVAVRAHRAGLSLDAQ